MSLLTVLYALVSILLSVYGLNAFVLLYLYLRQRGRHVPCPPLTGFPEVTVQLPVYNERYVIERAIHALIHLDWPQDRLQIQILDDSTDDTTAIALQSARQYRERGFDVHVLHRAERTGYKAGAMNAGMPGVKGAFIAIFDADFCPPPDFLRRTVPHLVADPGLGFVQARWGHLNDEFSALTMAQAIALDGHFAVEHVARESADMFTNFSGTGGVWQRRCIEECGGWDPEVLTEDLDLSYRAQLAGWKGRTLVDVIAPAELPAELGSFVQQQFRWAKGNTQCFLRRAWSLLRAPVSWMTRIQALIHLSYYVAHPLMLAVMALTLPVIWFDLLQGWALAFLSLATFGPPAMYVVAQRALYANWRHRLIALPVLICLGTGLAFNSTVAVLEAVLGIKSAFQRTPKYQIEGRRGGWQERSYGLSARRALWGELLCAIYAILSAAAAASSGKGHVVPFLCLYVLGFGFVVVLQVIQRSGRTT